MKRLDATGGSQGKISQEVEIPLRRHDLYSRLQTLHIEKVPVYLINRLKTLASLRKMTMKELVLDMIKRELERY